jgi:ribonucleotide monophosphatase NagD (HAD superfamily)
MISKDNIFFESEVENFIDVGTSEDWFDFNNKPTYFCDIDGTIVKSKWDYYDDVEPIWDNVSALVSKKQEGCKIIFTTSRPEKYRKLTQSILDGLGFAGCDLIMGIHHSKRVLINDYATSNPYPTAVAVNIKRDSEDLGDML